MPTFWQIGQLFGMMGNSDEKRAIQLRLGVGSLFLRRYDYVGRYPVQGLACGILSLTLRVEKDLVRINHVINTY